MKFDDLEPATVVTVCIYIQEDCLDRRYSKTMTWIEWIAGPFGAIEDMKTWGGTPRRTGQPRSSISRDVTLADGVSASLYVSSMHPIVSWNRFRLNAESSSHLENYHDQLVASGWILRDKTAKCSRVSESEIRRQVA